MLHYVMLLVNVSSTAAGEPCPGAPVDEGPSDGGSAVSLVPPFQRPGRC